MSLYTPSKSCEYMMGRVLSDKDTLVDAGHRFLDEVEEAPWCSMSPRSLAHARLVAHEWLANLVQYGDFGDRELHIAMLLQLDRTRARFIFDDNSAGFDFYGRMRTQAEMLGALPNRGLGLLMIAACTKDLSYQRLSPCWNRLTFTLGGEQPALEIPLSEGAVRRKTENSPASAAA